MYKFVHLILVPKKMENVFHSFFIEFSAVLNTYGNSFFSCFSFCTHFALLIDALLIDSDSTVYTCNPVSGEWEGGPFQCVKSKYIYSSNYRTISIEMTVNFFGGGRVATK